MAIKVRMVPHLEQIPDVPASGIDRVVERYFHYLPRFDIDLVAPDATSYDLLAIHAGMCQDFQPNDPIVAHCHGLYFSADYDAAQWEHEGNGTVINVLRHAASVTVPSPWVAEPFCRDMHLTPHVIPHGVDWAAWQGGTPGDYLLWNKNRPSDACDPTPVTELAERLPGQRFISTFVAQRPPRNVRVTGALPHEQMRDLVKGAGIYLATTKETFGIGTLEALASGVPVLGWDWGSTADLVTHGRNGYLAAPGDYDDLAYGAGYIFKHHERLSRQARQGTQFFTWEEPARLVARVYADTLAKVQRRAWTAIVIPIFNKVATLRRAVESALRQSLVDAVVLVDNNSTDGSRELAQQLVAENEMALGPIVLYTECAEQGVAHARNHGIRQVPRHDYICCLDADDELAPGYITRCVRHLEADNSLAVAYTGLTAVRPDGTRVLSDWPGDFDYEQFIVGNNQIPTAAVFRRDFWQRAGGYRQRYAPQGAGAEDAEFFLRIGALGGNAKKVSDENLFLYHLGGQVSGNAAYVEPDWVSDKPWTQDGRHPFASVAQPANGLAHLVRAYDQPLVSIVIPCGPGHARYLVDCLDSIEAQRNRQWEVILVADVAEDEYWDIHRLVEDGYPFVKLVWPARAPVGAGQARNLGVEEARAPLLLFLDADDWLLPDALNALLAGYAANPLSIIYGSYVGHAYLHDERELAALRQRQRLLAYDEQTHEATILYPAPDFDCEQALRQPDAARPYIWNTITSLLPKQFHRHIGGFDAGMESWEDWDYWLRMARAGFCFAPVEKPVLAYRFYTGTRRALANPTESGDNGRQLSAKLLEYMTTKYEGEQAMGCKSCGGSRRRHVPPPSPLGRMQTLNEGGVGKMAGDDFVWVTLNDGNSGSHRIVFERYDYGYRSHGERFKMRLDHAQRDQRVQIDTETPASEAASREGQTLVMPKAEKKALEPVSEPQPVAEKVTTQTAPSGDVKVVGPDGQPAKDDGSDKIVLDAKSAYDFTPIWGIGQERNEVLHRRGVRSLSGLIALGEDGIRKALDVPEKTAQRILQSAQETQARG